MGKTWHFYVGEGNDTFASMYILCFCVLSLLIIFHNVAN